MSHCTFISFHFISFHFKLLDIATPWRRTLENFIVPDMSRNYRLIDITHLQSNDVKVSVLGCRHRVVFYSSTGSGNLSIIGVLGYLIDRVMQYVKEIYVLYYQANYRCVEPTCWLAAGSGIKWLQPATLPPEQISLQRKCPLTTSQELKLTGDDNRK